VNYGLSSWEISSKLSKREVSRAALEDLEPSLRGSTVRSAEAGWLSKKAKPEPNLNKRNFLQATNNISDIYIAMLSTLLLTVITVLAGRPTTSDIQSLRNHLKLQLDPILQSKPLTDAKIGAMVIRLQDGAELFTRHPDELFVPASTVKIITSAAALNGLPLNYQFPTEVYGDAKNPTTLYIKGYGDPYLIPERLYALANRIYYLGIREIKGDIVVDDSFFEGERNANGRQQDLTSSAYNAPAGAVSVGFNVLRVHVIPADKAHQKAQVEIEPGSDYARIVGSIETTERGKTHIDVQVEPIDHRSLVRVSGKILKSDGIKSFWRRIDNPPIYAGEVLKRMLEQLGIKIAGKVKEGLTPPELPKITEILSPTLGELLGPLNKHSNNFMAAQLAYVLGAQRFGPPGSWEKGSQAIAEFLNLQVGIRKDSYQLGNASGLHDVNRLSPRQLVQVLRYMSLQAHVWPEFMASLAMPGGEGTLHDRFKETDIAPRLRVKTGTLAKASALAGYITTPDGQNLAFVFFVNDYKTDHANVIDVQDKFAAALARLQLADTTAWVRKP
jgi:serine-type D-Ala-D-Ala carboxypeptidase/endopeptidase (penicillin-binding protein 4)